MTKHFDDSVGLSTRIHGSEERSWKYVLDAWDTMDTYLIAVNRKESIFIKHTFYGLRFDQSRLDRIYASHRGNWYSYINEIIEHDGK